MCVFRLSIEVEGIKMHFQGTMKEFLEFAKNNNVVVTGGWSF
jgi:hypothetical protein